jgi:hypothetical protein
MVVAVRKRSGKRGERRRNAGPLGQGIELHWLPFLRIKTNVSPPTYSVTALPAVSPMT